MDKSVRTAYLIRQIQLHCRTRFDEVLQAFALTTGQYTILSILERRDGLSAAQLSRRHNVTPQSMNVLIGALEEKGLISRREAPENRRILRATLTRAGKDLLARCEEAIDRAEADIFGTLSKSELTALRQALQKVAATLRNEERIPA